MIISKTNQDTQIALIGAGTMGLGIAQVFAKSDEFSVLLCSSDLDSAQKGYSKIEKLLDSRVLKNKITQEEKQSILARIKPSTTDKCKQCNLVIESITENLDEKRKLFAYLDKICNKDCIFVTNTSSLSITEIASGIEHPVVGMHFFNPAPVMKLIEITPGLNTPIGVVQFITDIAKSIGKTPVIVKENAGFVVNRILIPMINEAIGLYAEGIASVEGIDSAMKLGANHPMGPLALGDLIGLDICLAIMETLLAETGDSKYRPHPLLRKMVRGGWLGKKTGKGFYIYNKEE